MAVDSAPYQLVTKKMWNRGTIRSRVMASLEKKVTDAEKEYKEECLKIDHDAEVAKMDFANDLVNRLVGKFV